MEISQLFLILVLGKENEDHTSNNCQRLLIQSLLCAVRQSATLAFDSWESLEWSQGKLSVCPDWRQFVWERCR